MCHSNLPSTITEFRVAFVRLLHCRETKGIDSETPRRSLHFTCSRCRCNSIFYTSPQISRFSRNPEHTRSFPFKRKKKRASGSKRPALCTVLAFSNVAYKTDARAKPPVGRCFRGSRREFPSRLFLRYSIARGQTDGENAADESSSKRSYRRCAAMIIFITVHPADRYLRLFPLYDGA